VSSVLRVRGDRREHVELTGFNTVERKAAGRTLVPVFKSASSPPKGTFWQGGGYTKATKMIASAVTKGHDLTYFCGMQTRLRPACLLLVPCKGASFRTP
jgi:hypothetical protein